MGRPPAEIQDQSKRLQGTQLLFVFFGLQLALFLSFLDSTSVSTAAPIIGQDLNASSSITWVGTSFLVANTSFQIVSSRLSDIFGRKIVLLGALFLFVLGDLLCGFAENAIWLYCCRAVAGIGGGGINSLSMIIVSDVVAMKDRGAAQGLLGIAISLGSGLGPFVGGLFAQRVSWRWTFWITPPMGAITMVIIWFLLPLNPVSGDLLSKVKRMDWLGTVLSLAMTVCLLVPLSGGGTTFEWKSPVVIALFVISAVSAAAFIVVEARLASLPLLPGRIFKNRNIALLLGQTFLVGAVYYGNIFYIPLYAQNVRGMGAISSAAIILPLLLVQTFTTVISGYVVKYTGYTKSSFVVGFVFWAAGQGAQLCFGRTTSTGVIVGVLLVQGMGIGATLQSTLVLAQASGVSADRAVVTGARNFARTSGGAIGLAVGNSILNNVFSSNLPLSLPAELRAELKRDFVLPDSLTSAMRDEILDAYMKGIRTVFILFVPIVGICLLLCLFIKDISLEEPKSVPLPPPADLDLEKNHRRTEEEEEGSETAGSDLSTGTTPTLCDVPTGQVEGRQVDVDVYAKN